LNPIFADLSSDNLMFPGSSPTRRTRGGGPWGRVSDLAAGDGEMGAIRWQPDARERHPYSVGRVVAASALLPDRCDFFEFI